MGPDMTPPPAKATSVTSFLSGPFWELTGWSLSATRRGITGRFGMGGVTGRSSEGLPAVTGAPLKVQKTQWFLLSVRKSI